LRKILISCNEDVISSPSRLISPEKFSFLVMQTSFPDKRSHFFQCTPLCSSESRNNVVTPSAAYVVNPSREVEGCTERGTVLDWRSN
jgi:hypothetical protein